MFDVKENVSDICNRKSNLAENVLKILLLLTGFLR